MAGRDACRIGMAEGTRFSRDGGGGTWARVWDRGEVSPTGAPDTLVSVRGVYQPVISNQRSFQCGLFASTRLILFWRR